MGQISACTGNSGFADDNSWAAFVVRLAVHEEGGPLQRFLDELFGAFIKSPQTMAIAAVHLCGLWVQHPGVALLYLDFWERLLLYGSTDSATLKASELSSEARACSCLPLPHQRTWMPHEIHAKPLFAKQAC